MYRVVFSKEAAKDAKKLRATGLAEKAKKLVERVGEDPFAHPPAFEPLVGNLSGMYSRRINRQHRFVYEVVEEAIIVDDCTFEGTVKVLSMRTHYETL
ncbi:Txe/YoeB family addiction module toxin [Adlercreutzia murintestinalis]|uniref:Txe/YoeB family addiction module toxin n=1 Tax=Adlercreutzia murintestinalis TaxID=2941325 RepID=UPI00203D757F|nr:Txe/YoeB family addiction module toxin [Adlercreutzia murintestinalis]